jgi:hypothetical protein
LLLYGLYRPNFEKFEDQLKQSAVFLSSRTQLLYAIIHGWPENMSVRIPGKTIQEPEILLTPVETAPEIETVNKSLIPPGELKTSEPAFSYDETFTFSLEDTQTIEISEKREEEIAGKSELPADLLEFDLGLNQEDETVDLIDTFLKVNPRIVPKLDPEDSRGDISQPCLEENEEIVTETLASIYEQQGHFVKAKVAYEKLILKFPEKSAYFASRIQELEKRIK